MDFLSGFFIAIATFFGFGQPAVEVPEQVMTEEVIIENKTMPMDNNETKEEDTSQEVVLEEAEESSDTLSVESENAVTVSNPVVVEPEESMVVVWQDYKKPSKDILKNQLDPLAYEVTQEDGTERAGSSPLDKNWEDGIYVDILSGEPLYSSKDKFDSGTGWPSFVKPIVEGALTEHEDKKLFRTRIETRSAIADNHIGHVFTDGPADRGGLRYCMNGVALKFIPKAEMEELGYGDFLQYI